MSVRKIALVAAMAALGLATAYAADAPAAPDSGAATTMPHDCGMPMARHDHGAEKGTPTPPMAMKCAMATEAAVAATPKTKAKRGHDHARTHKLM